MLLLLHLVDRLAMEHTIALEEIAELYGLLMLVTIRL
jgi:hypothetical protein